MNDNPASRLARRGDAALVVVDIQEKLFPLMAESDTLEWRVRQLVAGCAAMGVPVIVTEQYKKGLGDTVSGLIGDVSARFIEKTTFSCFGSDEFVDVLRQTECSQIIVCGIESHICVLQTALHGLREGYDVFVAADAVSSRQAGSRHLARHRMERAGAILATAEGLLFEMLETCEDPAFKTILPLVKEAR